MKDELAGLSPNVNAPPFRVAELPVNVHPEIKVVEPVERLTTAIAPPSPLGSAPEAELFVNVLLVTVNVPFLPANAIAPPFRLELHEVNEQLSIVANSFAIKIAPPFATPELAFEKLSLETLIVI